MIATMTATQIVSDVTASSSILSIPTRKTKHSYYLPLGAEMPASANTFEDIQQAIREIQTFKENWNGYGALPTSHRVLRNVLSFAVMLSASREALPTPDISPLENGTVGFTWETLKGEAYLEIGNNRFSAYISNKGAPTEYFQGDASQIEQDFIKKTHERLFSSGREYLGYGVAELTVLGPEAAAVSYITKY